MDEIAARLNTVMRDLYGLDRDVFFVQHTSCGLPGLALIDANDEGSMHHFALTLEYMGTVFAENDPRPNQLRLF